MALNIDGTTGISGVDGSASAPALTGTDSNTGINFASDTVNINTGGLIRATVDSNGRLGIGTSSPATTLHCQSSGDTILRVTSADGNGAFLDLGDVSDPDAGRINYDTGNNLVINTSSSERLRIDSAGRALFGATSHTDVGNGSVNALYLYNGSLITSRDNTGNREHTVFHNPNGDVGSINTSGSSTSYTTSSDYRLKENATAISDGITRLKTLKPYRFNFKVDKDTTVDGFFAHEVTAVPEAITGTKDAVVTQAMINAGDYEEGTLNNPIYQGIDQSKLVPLLTAALQEAVAKIEVLETKVAALEAG